MGSTMKRSIFDEETSKALTKWRKNAKKKNDGKPAAMPTQKLGGTVNEDLHVKDDDHDHNYSHDHP